MLKTLSMLLVLFAATSCTAVDIFEMTILGRNSPAICFPPPSDADLEAALDYVGDTFSAAEGWTENIRLDPGFVTIVWLQPDGVASLYHTDRGCVQNPIDPEDYVLQNFGFVFLEWQSAEITETCTNGDITLHETALINDGEPYEGRMWVDPISDTHFIFATLSFPEREQGRRLDAYAEQLFPDLPSCDAVLPKD